MRHIALSIFLLALCSCGGGGGDDEPCTPGTAEGCSGLMVCEQVTDDEPACFPPLLVQGRITDLETGDGVADARVLLLDANGSPRSGVAVTDDEGYYSAAVPMERADDGSFQAESVTLRVSAPGYVKFPLPPRTAIPIDLGQAEGEDELAVSLPAASVGLIPLPDSGEELGWISGRVDHDDAAGMLIVATQAEAAVSTGYAGLDGDFILFNVPEGEVVLAGYQSGLYAPPVSVELSGDSLEDVVLPATDQGLGSVSGSVSIVNAPGGSKTSVILVLEAAFNEASISGEAPKGLRAGDVDGDFKIEGVPPGRYVVLAAFENDGLVRDPDESIGGTEIVHIEVPEGGGPVQLEKSFKVTEALAIFSPGAAGVEEIAAGDPTFTWADDSSEDGYELRVFDATGQVVHEVTDLPDVSGSDQVTYTWAGAQLEAGQLYQFRVMSFQEKKDERTYLSATEDLLGAFLVSAQ